MKGSFTTESPDKIHFTLTLTAELNEWERLREHLAPERWPDFELRRIIDDVVSQAKDRFYPKQH